MKPMIFGDHLFNQSGHFDGMISGRATVVSDVELKLSGMVGGDPLIVKGATVHLSGMVGGRIRNDGGRVISTRTP